MRDSGCRVLLGCSDETGQTPDGAEYSVRPSEIGYPEKDMLHVKVASENFQRRLQTLVVTQKVVGR